MGSLPLESEFVASRVSNRQFLFKKDSRVALVLWARSGIIDDYETVPRGTEGTVTGVDDLGTIHVRWDNGASLGVTLDDSCSST